MNVHFDADGWKDFLSWTVIGGKTADEDVLETIIKLIEDIRRDPFKGLGRPEPLKNDLQGWWSRRITQKHRLIYRVRGIGEDQRLQIASCRNHY